MQHWLLASVPNLLVTANLIGWDAPYSHVKTCSRGLHEVCHHNIPYFLGHNSLNIELILWLQPDLASRDLRCNSYIIWKDEEVMTTGTMTSFPRKLTNSQTLWVRKYMIAFSTLVVSFLQTLFHNQNVQRTMNFWADKKWLIMIMKRSRR